MFSFECLLRQFHHRSVLRRPFLLWAQVRWERRGALHAKRGKFFATQLFHLTRCQVLTLRPEIGKPLLNQSSSNRKNTLPDGFWCSELICELIFVLAATKWADHETVTEFGTGCRLQQISKDFLSFRYNSGQHLYGSFAFVAVSPRSTGCQPTSRWSLCASSIKRKSRSTPRSSRTLSSRSASTSSTCVAPNYRRNWCRCGPNSK